MRAKSLVVAEVVLILLMSLVMDRIGEAGQDSLKLKGEVEDSLKGRDFNDIEVAVTGDEVTLSGHVPHFWAKDQAIKRVLNIERVETVASELKLPDAESDQNIAKAVTREIQRYPHYTMWDDLTARVQQGGVFIGGWVTPDRDKASELFERVAKIKGVQNVENTIQSLSPSSNDRRIRSFIARQLRSNIHFDRITRMKNPPIRIVVNNGHVRLLGYVQGQIETIELQRIVAQTPGVLRVQNEVQILQ